MNIRNESSGSLNMQYAEGKKGVKEIVVLVGITGILALTFPSCMTLGLLLDLSEAPFPHGDNSSCTCFMDS